MLAKTNKAKKLFRHVKIVQGSSTSFPRKWQTRGEIRVIIGLLQIASGRLPFLIVDGAPLFKRFKERLSVRIPQSEHLFPLPQDPLSGPGDILSYARLFCQSLRAEENDPTILPLFAAKARLTQSFSEKKPCILPQYPIFDSEKRVKSRKAPWEGRFRDLSI